MRGDHNGRYILAGHTPVPCRDLMTWATWLEKADSHVGLTEIGDVRVRTVFLGLDHSFSDNAEDPPILFETLVFGGELEGEGERCATWEQAEQQHAAMVARVRGKFL